MPVESTGKRACSSAQPGCNLAPSEAAVSSLSLDSNRGWQSDKQAFRASEGRFQAAGVADFASSSGSKPSSMIPAQQLSSASATDPSPFRNPQLVFRAKAAAENALAAAAAAAQIAEDLEAAHDAGSDTGSRIIDTARQLAELASNAAKEATTGAAKLAENCYYQGRAAAAPAASLMCSQQLPASDGDLFRQQRLCEAYSKMLLDLLEDPAKLRRAGTAYGPMQIAGLAAEWAWLESKFKPAARLSRLLHNLKHRKKGEFGAISASLRELLPHAFSNLHWLMRTWAAGHEEAEALKQDLLLDATLPKPNNLAAAAAKTHALRQLFISYKMQALLAAPARYCELKAIAASMPWWVRTDGKATLSAWHKQREKMAKDAAAKGSASAKKGADTAGASRALDRCTSSPDSPATPSHEGAAHSQHSPSVGRQLMEQLIAAARVLVLEQISKGQQAFPSSSSSPSPTHSTQHSPRQAVDGRQTSSCRNHSPSAQPVRSSAAGSPNGSCSQHSGSMQDSPESEGSAGRSKLARLFSPVRRLSPPLGLAKMSPPKLYSTSSAASTASGGTAFIPMAGLSSDAMPLSAERSRQSASMQDGCSVGQRGKSTGAMLADVPSRNNPSSNGAGSDSGGSVEVTRDSLTCSRTSEKAQQPMVRATSPHKLSPQKHNSPSPTNSETSNHSPRDRSSPTPTVRAPPAGQQYNTLSSVVPRQSHSSSAGTAVGANCSSSATVLAEGSLHVLGDTTGAATLAARPTSPPAAASTSSMQRVSPTGRFPGRSPASASRLGLGYLQVSASFLAQQQQQVHQQQEHAQGDTSTVGRTSWHLFRRGARAAVDCSRSLSFSTALSVAAQGSPDGRLSIEPSSQSGVQRAASMFMHRKNVL